MSKKRGKKNPLIPLGLIMGGVILFFVLIIVVQEVQYKKVVKDGNPYGDRPISQLTKNTLTDKNYQNIILPEELKTRLESGESLTVYFFSPSCEYCNLVTPVIVPLSQDLGVDLHLYNVYEFEEGWDDYNITATPTVVYFKNGKEVNRIVGYQPEDIYKNWFESVVKK